MTVHALVKPGPMASIVSIVQYGMQLGTLALCVAQGHCPAFLPTISDTWVYSPETNISRGVVGNVAILMGLIQFTIYYMDTEKLSPKWNKILTGVGYVSCFGLAGVGAVCDNARVADCRGDNTTHVVLAAIFFGCYNAQMILRTLFVYGKVAGLGVAVAVLLPKVRWLSAFPGGLGGFPAGAVAEWTDVALLCIWTSVWCLARGKSLRLAIIDQATKGGDDPAPLFPFFSMTVCMYIACVLYIGTIAICGGAHLINGHWPRAGWPFLADIFVYPPGNWWSRYGLVAVATVAGFVHVLAYFIQKDATGPGSSLKMAILACVALGGAAVVGCVDERENTALNLGAAVVFLGGYNIFMVLSAISLVGGGHVSHGAAAAAAAAVSVATKLRFAPTAAPAAGVGVGWGPQDVAAVATWVDAAAVIAFFVVFVRAQGPTAANIGLCNVRAPAEGGAGDDAELVAA